MGQHQQHHQRDIGIYAVLLATLMFAHGVQSTLPDTDSGLQQPQIPTDDEPLDSQPIINLAISARQHLLEIAWTELAADQPGTVFVTDVPLPAHAAFQHDPSANASDRTAWTIVGSRVSVLYALAIDSPVGWHTTDVRFDRSATVLTVQTRCYGFWATFVPQRNQTARVRSCLRAHPRWMHEQRAHIEPKRWRELLLLGTHDSGSYRQRFDPRRNETRVSKYTLTQDDDVAEQLLLGVRYLDLRIGSYRTRQPADRPDAAPANGGRTFWVNHGIYRAQPLDDVLQQVRTFVGDTGELVIVDMQEFPVGFDSIRRHHALVVHVQRLLGDVLVDAAIGWNAPLRDFWRSTGGRGGVLLAYDQADVVDEFPELLFQSVRQRWGDVQSPDALLSYLTADVSQSFLINYMHRPYADMAELTPTPWDVLTDQLGGLRRMADQTNRAVSMLYAGELGRRANIVAVDFVRGTTLMDSCLRWNRRRPVDNY